MLSARNDDDDTCHGLVSRRGANRQALDASGVQYFTVHTHANQHAGYFPGAKPVHILMHVGTYGQILGAQAAGADGVDRRIDVVATAMRAGLKATDLIDLDLAYAPPYGQAKDPVNQTGMVAHNVLTGELVLTGPNELAEDMPVLDVRTPGEYAAGHMPNSLNITFPTPSCGCGSERRPRPSSSRGRAKPADSGHENDPVSQCEAVEFLVTTESVTTDKSESIFLRLASCDGATSLRRAEVRNTMARIR